MMIETLVLVYVYVCMYVRVSQGQETLSRLSRVLEFQLMRKIRRW